MAYDITISDLFDDTGAGSYILVLYVRSEERDGVNNRSRYAYELQGRWLSGSPRRHNLDAGTFGITIGGNTVYPSHNLDFRSTDTVSIYAGTTGWFSHDSSGNLNLPVRAWISEYDIFGSADTSGTLVADRLPRKASAPGKPFFSEELPTSVRVAWSEATNDGGTPIDSYLLRYWPNAEGTGPYVDHSTELNLTRLVTGLTPGQFYKFIVYAHNGSGENGGFSNSSEASVIQMLAGARIRVGGVWKMAMPYIKVGGVWKMALPYVKDSGTWKITR